ncbi:unnamed protein product [Rotaria sp. Silwood2]|nr:unnamed protein product [Rotaria sp. Silwood2]CAF2860174.1 unnamed protein product [Rotaria sp. Silwood2]CAF3158173.1 unnamed protein product [Rotaria sp. Silwood2]CAF4004131.1 unnamed protein product [Rotaria sp. Silwood2]CAF4075492.1 unnamed protein product [Rotaria sp. Silwood2]
MTKAINYGKIMADFLTDLYNTFGLNCCTSSIDDIDTSPFQKFISIYKAVCTQKEEILALHDYLKDKILPGLSIQIEKQDIKLNFLYFEAGMNKTIIKFWGLEMLKHEREQALVVEESKQEEKEQSKFEKQLDKEEQKKASEEKEGKKCEVLVFGGAGFIGSHCVIEHFNAGYESLVLNNEYNSSTG